MAWISGTIYDSGDSDHSPLSDVDVWAESFDTGTYGEATSDSLGHYLIAPIDPGPGYILYALGMGYSRWVLEGLPVPDEGLNQDIGLVRLGAISGSVLTATTPPLPVSGANIYLSQLDAPFWGGGQGLTDSDGMFYIDTVHASSIDNVSGSNYGILVVPSDYSFVEDQQVVSPHYAEGDEVEVHYNVRPRATIRGFITSAGIPLAGARATIYYNADGLLVVDQEEYITDAGGQFTMIVHAPATYGIAIQGEGTEFFNAHVSVDPGETVPLTVDLAGPGTIAGTVSDLTGTSIAGATIELLTETGTGPVQRDQVLTDLNGNYQIVGVQPGANHLVAATLPGLDIYTTFPSEAGVSVVPGAVSTVNLDGDTEPPTCRFISPTPGATASGIVPVIVEISDNQGIYSAVLKVSSSQLAEEIVAGSDLSDFFNLVALPGGRTGWSIYNEPRSYDIAKERPGWLRVHAAANAAFSEDEDSGHLFYADLSGDVQLETQLSSVLSAVGESLGLMLRQDSANWLLFVQRFDVSQPSLVTLKKQAGIVSVLNSTPLPADPLSLRIQRVNGGSSGSSVITYYSLDGSTWVLHASDVDFLADQLLGGLAITAGVSDDFTADFNMLFFQQTKMQWDWYSSAFQNDTYTLTATAYDLAGNAASSSVSVEVMN